MIPGHAYKCAYTQFVQQCYVRLFPIQLFWRVVSLVRIRPMPSQTPSTTTQVATKAHKRAFILTTYIQQMCICYIY